MRGTSWGRVPGWISTLAPHFPCMRGYTLLVALSLRFVRNYFPWNLNAAFVLQLEHHCASWCRPLALGSYSRREVIRAHERFSLAESDHFTANREKRDRPTENPAKIILTTSHFSNTKWPIYVTLYVQIIKARLINFILRVYVSARPKYTFYSMF